MINNQISLNCNEFPIRIQYHISSIISRSSVILNQKNVQARSNKVKALMFVANEDFLCVLTTITVSGSKTSLLISFCLEHNVQNKKSMDYQK